MNAYTAFLGDLSVFHRPKLIKPHDIHGRQISMSHCKQAKTERGDELNFSVVVNNDIPVEWSCRCLGNEPTGGLTGELLFGDGLCGGS